MFWKETWNYTVQNIGSNYFWMIGILKDDAVKVLHSYVSKFGKLSSGHRTGKGQFSFQSQKRQCQRMLNYHTIAFISYTSKVMFKILQTRLQQYMKHELENVQSGFRKGRKTEIKLPKSTGSLKKQESSRKKCTSALLTMPKPLTVWITKNCGKFFRSCEYQSTWLAS